MANNIFRRILICIALLCIIYIVDMMIANRNKLKIMMSENLGAKNHYDPVDPSILRLSRNNLSECHFEPDLTFVSKRGFLHRNQKAFEQTNKTSSNVCCKFSGVLGVDGKGNKIVRGTYKYLNATPVKISSEFIQVSCFDEGGLHIYETCHFKIQPPNLKDQKLVKSGRPNVLLLGLDSVSRLSFHRNLPLSYKFVTEKLRAVVMKGMTKVGPDMEANMIPFLSGYRKYENNNDETPAFCRFNGACDVYFQDDPIVWQNFSGQGYITMWIGELPQTQLLYDISRGYRRSPTDYFPQPLITCLEEISSHSNDPCLRHFPMTKVVFDYTEKFMNAMENNSFFAFSFISKISQHNGSTFKALDRTLASFLKRIHNGGTLNNTMLVLFGDRGHRVGDIRNTLIGAVEDRMPFMSILLPQTLRRQKPHLQAGLEHNADRLLSWFDMYEMLLDLATNNLEETSRVTRWGSHVGRSPFRPLPAGRLCRDAGVPREYCTCTTPVSIDVAEDGVLEAAEQVIAHVNEKLEAVKRECVVFGLDRIESAHVIYYEESEDIAVLRLVVRTDPGLALFEGTLEVQGLERNSQVLGVVDRLDLYEADGHCLDGFDVSKMLIEYCYCK